MSNSIHWDYAESFSGRDAAYLIAGFDPSSHSAEDAYRAQPIIKKLKEAYYLACAEIKYDMADEYPEATFLHCHRYKKEELLSVKLEGMLNRFINSEYVAGGNLARLQGLDQHGKNFDPKNAFPETDALEAAKLELKKAVQKRHAHWISLDAMAFDRWVELEQSREELSEKYREKKITWNQFWNTEVELRDQIQRLRNLLEEKAAQDDPSIEEEVSHAEEKVQELKSRENDWSDHISMAYANLDDQLQPMRHAAVDEAYEWQRSFYHEFDDQKFSRAELQRWISDNGFPSQYQFKAIAPPAAAGDAGQQEVSARSEAAYLNIIGALMELYWEAAHEGEKYSQVTLLAALKPYDGFDGLSESNLKRKLTLAWRAMKAS